MDAMTHRRRTCCERIIHNKERFELIATAMQALLPTVMECASTTVPFLQESHGEGESRLGYSPRYSLEALRKYEA
jgi:hypothetical protein